MSQKKRQRKIKNFRKKSNKSEKRVKIFKGFLRHGELDCFDIYAGEVEMSTEKSYYAMEISNEEIKRETEDYGTLVTEDFYNL